MKKRKKFGVGCGVMILRGNKILLGKRQKDHLKGGGVSWTMPGGKLEFRESFEKCIIRETKEETSIKLKNPQVICINNDKAKYAHFVTIGFLAKNFTGKPKIMEPDIITEWKWFNLDNLPGNIFMPSAKIIKNYLADKFYLDG